MIIYKEFINESLRDKMIGRDMKKYVLDFINKEYDKNSNKQVGKEEAIKAIKQGLDYNDIYYHILRFYQFNKKTRLHGYEEV